jgi:hypothetical protein
MAMETRKKSDGDVVMFMVFMALFFIRDEQARVDITRHWLNVWQESCQAMGSQRNFHCGAKERRTRR